MKQEKKDNIQTLKNLFAKDKTKINNLFCENCGENLVFTFKNENVYLKSI